MTNQTANLSNKLDNQYDISKLHQGGFTMTNQTHNPNNQHDNSYGISKLHQGGFTMSILIRTTIQLLTISMLVFGLSLHAQADSPLSQITALVIDQIEIQDYRDEWLKADLDARKRLGETIAEEGARDLARKNKLAPIFEGNPGGVGGYPQGVDQVYISPKGKVVVFEVKANNSALSQAYGYPQGSPEYTVKAAERMLKSTRSSRAQKEAAEAIILAAEKGLLETHVVRINHVQGSPTGITITKSSGNTHAAKKMAQEIKKNYNIQSSLDDLQKVAKRNWKNFARGGAQGLKVVLRWSGPLAAVVEAGTCGIELYDIHGKVKSGDITAQEAGRTYTTFGTQTAGGVVGAWGGAKGGAIAGGVGGTVFGPLGSTVGAIGGAIVGGIAGAYLGEQVGQNVGEITYDYWFNDDTLSESPE